ncbi:MAG: peptide MFS transporter [Paludibacteraceae bacterium]|nr:peptide MFS transporter [Bacteroidales bacterium]MBP5742539.1 peptide MFS transporter [Paludibacteraceae bacterium]
MNMINKHPKGLYLLFVTEMAERFSYYGMRALFVLYLVAAFFDEKVSSQIYGSYTGLVYLTPLLGGYIADRYWGNRRSIVVGGLIMALGQFLLFASACFVRQSIFAEGGVIDASVDNSLATALLLSGLVALILGNGFFKPNISTMVGDLYAPADHRKDSAYTIFYMGINVGAFIAPFVCGTLGEGSWNDLSPFKWGFFSAGVAMLLSVAVFVLFKNRYLVTFDGKPIGLPHKKVAQPEAKTEQKVRVKNSPLRVVFCIAIAVGLFILFASDTLFADSGSLLALNDYTSAAIYAISIALPLFIITDRSLSRIEKCRIGVIYIIALFVIFFWSAFEQAGSSLTIFADKQVDRTLLGCEFKTTWFQSINPIVVVCFAPIMALLWERLAKRRLEPASPVKQAIGLFLLAIGYVVIAVGTHNVDTTAKVSMFWLVALYFIHTIGELSLSPIGLSMVNKLSPKHLASLLMGVWFMSNAASNILAGKLATLLPTPNSEPAVFCGVTIDALDTFFLLFAVMAAVAAVLLLALCPLLKRMMYGVE